VWMLADACPSDGGDYYGADEMGGVQEPHNFNEN